jgi:hypothetical protein
MPSESSKTKESRSRKEGGDEKKKEKVNTHKLALKGICSQLLPLHVADRSRLIEDGVGICM